MKNHLVPSPTRSIGRFAQISGRVLCALALTAGASAQPPSAPPGSIVEPPRPLPPMVVTATRVPTLAEETAASVTVISREDIAQSQFTDALTALKSVPGLNLTDGGVPGQTAGLFLRGTESRHTVILLDGHRLPTGLQRYFDINYFPLGNIARIEVVRGPLGSTQGGGAIGGAINFITDHGASGATGGLLDGEYGSFNTNRAELALSVAKNGVYANVSGSHFATDNRRPNSEFEATSTLNTIGWDISPAARLELLAGYLHRDGGNPGSGTQTTASDPNASLEQKLGFLAPSLTFHVGEAWTHTLNFSYAKQDSFARQTPFASDNETAVRTQGLTYQADYRPSATVVLQAGVERNWQDADFTPTNGNTALPFTRHERDDAVFAGVQVQPVAGLTLLGSARRDVYESFYGSATTWRYGFSYRFGHTVVHASDGTAFAAPEIQNFVDFGFGALATSLRPERSRGQEIGFTQEINSRLVFGATAFQSQTHDLAQFSLLTFTVQNIGLAKMRGVETFAEYRLSAASLLRLNYTFLDAHDEIGNAPLLRRPRHTIGAEVRDEIRPDWLLGASVQAVMDREDTDPTTFIRGQAEDYVVLRMFTSYELNRNLRLKLRIENALNENYSETAGFPALPTAVHGGIEWRF